MVLLKFRMRYFFRKYYLLISFLLLSFYSRSQSFTNPILAGFYPDPSICRAGDDYYIVNSTFAYYPGLPVFHSKDLLNWELISYAINRPEQLSFEDAGVSRGLFAPAIAYHDGLFYIVCTDVIRLGNFVITAKDPKGPWSNPVKLPEVNGIDPSVFFDEDGKSFIVFNSIPPGNQSLWNGHRTIRMFEFDALNKRIKGEEKLLINGGTDTAKHPVWIEGPHLYKKDGWYYLMCAEGGTGYNHSEVVFRSRSVYGPFESYKKNPILTQRHLDTARKNPVTTTGHADLVEGKDGKWWGVFLGCRPYEGDYYNTGRETFMAPVEWNDGWPVFNLGGDEVKYSYPINAVSDKSKEQFSGNFHFLDKFDKGELQKRYSLLRTAEGVQADFHIVPGYLNLSLTPETCQGKKSPAFIGFRQSHLACYAAAGLQFYPKAENEKAGLLIFQSEKNFYFLGKSVKDGQPVVELYRDTSLLISHAIKAKDGKDVFLKIQAKGDTYSFFYAVKKNRWQLLLDKADGKYLSTKKAGGFVGSMYAMYGTSNGKPTDNAVMFHWFEYKGNDDVYK